MSRSLQQPAHGWMRNTRSVPTHPLGLGRKPQSGTRTAAPLRGAAVDPAVQTSPAGGGGSGGKTTNKDEKPDDNPGRNGKEQVSAVASTGAACLGFSTIYALPALIAISQ